jgi:polyhydroxybutyrate depolymerase
MLFAIPGRLAPRSRRRVTLVLCGFAVASRVGLASAYTTTAVDAGRGPVTVYVPNGYSPGTPIPLLLLLHGYSSSGPAVESWIGYLSAVDVRGFAYAFPSGRVDSFGQRFWTATDACCNLFNQGGPNDDSQYLRTLIDRIRQSLAIDGERIWIAGHSNGGFMAHRMACDHSRIIAGIVSLAGATFSDPAACAASQPVHVLEIHGTSDNVILYGGGSLSGRSYPGAVATSQSWAAKNRCEASLVSTTLGALDLVGGSDLETDVLRYSAGCDIPGSAEHWRMNGASHSPTLSASFRDRTLDFLFAHPKQRIRFLDAETLAWPIVSAAVSYDVYRAICPSSTLRETASRMRVTAAASASPTRTDRHHLLRPDGPGRRYGPRLHRRIRRCRLRPHGGIGTNERRHREALAVSLPLSCACPGLPLHLLGIVL